VKQCCRCKQTKPLCDFNKNKTKKDGFSDECKSCIANYVSSIAGKSSRLLSGCKRRAKLSGGKLTITREWLEDRLNKGVCELTGLPFNFSGRGKFSRQPYAPSVDKKDPQNPDYTPENTRVVLWAVNCAMAEYGEKIMLPIFKALINAKKNTASSVPTGDHRESEIYPELGTFSASGTWEDYYDLDHYQRTVRGEDADYRTQTRGGDGVGYGSTEVGAPQAPESEQDDWQLHPAYGWIKR
jgi:hypothetical protein